MSGLARDLARMLDPVAARAVFGASSKHPAMSPASLALAVDRTFEVPAHLELLDAAIVETVASGGRLLVAMPPRHGKSELCSRYTPAWYLGTHPEQRVMLASYEADFAAGWDGGLATCWSSTAQSCSASKCERTRHPLLGGICATMPVGW